ncbi:MAG: cell surface lipoprotein [Methanosarcinaceae archaeon]|nr:cell surface lipoprotein [Methanosarcinaceae archaeon]
MNIKYLALFFVIVSVAFAGCAEKEDSVQENSGDSFPSSEQASAEENDEDQTLMAAGELHMIRLGPLNTVNLPALEIPRGDTVSWWSHKKQGTFVLISEDRLFPAEELSYRVPFEYSFTASGTYLFTVEGIPEMNMTVTVM